MGVRVELATTGIDESLQGLSSDPYGAALPGTTGLRIPALRPDDTTRYLFLLATRVIDKPTRIRGIRQLLGLGATVSLGEGEYGPPLEFNVVTPTFKAPDGNVSWHLVMEPNAYPSPTVPSGRGWIQNTNFMFRQADGPALLFENATWGGGGQTAYYNVGLTGYAPPAIATSEWQQIAGLGNMHDIRFPWNTSQAWQSLDIPIRANNNRRISLYASVLQTTGITPPASTPSSPGIQSPENGFAATVNAVSGAGAILFWRVAGAIIFEDFNCACGEHREECDR